MESFLKLLHSQLTLLIRIVEKKAYWYQLQKFLIKDYHSKKEIPQMRFLEIQIQTILSLDVHSSQGIRYQWVRLNKNL